MNLRISAFSNYNVQYYRKRENKQNNIGNISFSGGHAVLLKPKMVNQDLQKLADKISSLLQALPSNSKLYKPMQIPLSKDVVGLMIDKTDSKISKVFLKLKQNSDKIESWESLNEFSEGIEMLVNDKGQMVEGNYYEVGGNHILFERNKNNIRRIKHRNEYYKPALNDIYPWRLIKAEQNALVGPDGFDYDREGFISFFFQMAESKTSFLAKK